MKPKAQKSMAKPIVIKVGNVQVKVYRSTRTKNSARYEQFDVADYSTGKRRFVTYPQERDAREKATEIATKLANREGEALTLTSGDRAAYLRALGFLQPTGVALEVATAQFADAHQKLGGRSLAEAVTFFTRHNPTTLPLRTVTEVLKEMLAAKAADGASAIYLKDLDFRLGKFAEAFQCQVGGVSAGEVNAYLRSLQCSGRSRNNSRLAIGTLFKFAEASGYLTKGHLDLSAVARAKENESEIEIFTVKEMSVLLAAAQLDPQNLTPGFNRRYATAPGLLPLLVLGGFAGMRTAEIERQLWEDINLERGFIRVTAAKGNTAQKRLIPIPDNLRQWLALCRRDSGLVCEIMRTPDALKRLAERAKVRWKHNALRHSYASYRMAEVKNAAQVSLDMGNSPKMVFRHYRELVTEADAKAWFAIVPKQTMNVITLPAGAA
jgi:integrase